MKRKNALLMGLVCLLFVAACMGTVLKNVWRDDGYTGKTSHVLILAVMKERAIRQMFEVELSRQLQVQGVSAVPSFTISSSDGVIDKKVILENARKRGIDSVIVTKVLDVKAYKERVTDINRTYRYFGDYRYSTHYRTYLRPGLWYDDYWDSYTIVRSYDVEYVISHAETGLYLLDGEQMVWSVLTETESRDDLTTSVKELASVIVEQLLKDGLI